MISSEPVQVRHVALGEGRPKICIPLISASLTALQQDAQKLCLLPCDLVEWRADCFADHNDPRAVREALELLRTQLGDKPLLFTFRTAGEGGSASLAPEAYWQLNQTVAESGLADLIDLELFSAKEETLQSQIEALHKAGVKVVVSSHDFSATPSVDEMTRSLLLARRLGADLPKLAVMPHTVSDVLSLLTATDQAVQAGAGPLITMSMGSLGGISRLGGEVFGSALSFGCAGRASAPGQFPAAALAQTLEILHESL